MLECHRTLRYIGPLRTPNVFMNFDSSLIGAVYSLCSLNSRREILANKNIILSLKKCEKLFFHKINSVVGYNVGTPVRIQDTFRIVVFDSVTCYKPCLKYWKRLPMPHYKHTQRKPTLIFIWESNVLYERPQHYSFYNILIGVHRHAISHTWQIWRLHTFQIHMHRQSLLLFLILMS